MQTSTPGNIALIGSGETSAGGGRVFDLLARRLDMPLKTAVLETPAGFEQNAGRVASRVSAFLRSLLGRYQAEVVQVEARQKGTPFSPDSLDIVRPLFDSSLIFCGPGSPTYAVRQFQDSLAWDVLQARHRLGAALAFASAATIATGRLALPVYEIFKVGEDPHWKPGLDLFGPYGLSLVIVPHWNNREGGEDLDTSRCFIGQVKFDRLLAVLPPDITVVGLDEHTTLILDFASETCTVMGVSSVHVIRAGHLQECTAGCTYPISDLGDYHPLPGPGYGLPEVVWKQALQAQAGRIARQSQGDVSETPPNVQDLVLAREQARRVRDWDEADRLRTRIQELGWQVADTPQGPVVARVSGDEG